MTPRLFPAFFDKPQNITFAEQETEERIELFLRQHWVTNIPWIFLALLAVLAPVLLVVIEERFRLNLFGSVPDQALIGGLVLWDMLVVAYALEKILYWYYNIYIVTNIHIVDIDFISLLFRQITEIELKDIESVRTEIRGVTRPLFHFGSVVIETAAKEQSIVFADVPKPDIVADRIGDLRNGLGGGE